VPPGVEHRQQVVGILVDDEDALPEVDGEVLEGGVPELAPDLVVVEGLREAPARVDPGERPEAAGGQGVRRVQALGERGVGAEGVGQRAR
jgi:hypothetical protein